MFFNLFAKRIVRCLSFNSIYGQGSVLNFPALSTRNWDLYNQQQQQRLKYTQHKGVKGLRNRKHQYEAKEKEENEAAEEMGEEFQQTLNLEDR